MSKLNNKIKTKARVRVLLEIHLPDTWGGDCALEQVYKQSKDSARNMISQKIAGTKDIKIIGEPEITAILTEE